MAAPAGRGLDRFRADEIWVRKNIVLSYGPCHRRQPGFFRTKSGIYRGCDPAALLGVSSDRFDDSRKRHEHAALQTPPS
ncbi:MAG TPA: hypothetical protein VK348_15455, partial [Planctomycetota bacterium]|nr:hypothetical protein [Planctomycetota bacterium]